MTDVKPTSPLPGAAAASADAVLPQSSAPAEAEPKPNRPDPTRYGDWELNGKCVDF